MNDQKKKIFENRADCTEKTKQPYCQSCGEELVFALKDNYHEFSLGLSTVLECLFIAESRGNIPSLPTEWKSSIFRRYPNVQRN